MSETKKLKSLTLIHGGSEKPKLSASFMTGEHLYLEISGPAQAALLLEQLAEYYAEQVRRSARA